MESFSNQIVLITGASSGIGQALARQFAQAGAKLVLTARRKERLDALAAELKQQGTQALAIACDVTQAEDLVAAVQETHQTLGKIDIVVANAGYAAINSFEQLSIEDYRKQLETNLFGVIHTIKATLEDLQAQHGTLALLGSLSGHISTPYSSAYAVSKFALRALGNSLHSEFAAKDISVVLISPGFIHSEIHMVDQHGKHQGHRKSQVPPWLPMKAEVAARKILKAIHRKKREYILTGHGKLVYYLNRLFPGLIQWYLKRLMVKGAAKPVK